MPKHDRDEYSQPVENGFAHHIYELNCNKYGKDAFIRTKSTMMGIVLGAELDDKNRKFLLDMMEEVSFREIMNDFKVPA